MGTRAIIARPTGDGFTGIYHHWDGYPTGLGATLVTLRDGFFKGSIEKMTAFLIDKHPAGWSTINGKDFSKPAGYFGIVNGATAPDDSGPECYCHGNRKEEAQKYTEVNSDMCEWAYVLNDDGLITVLRNEYMENNRGPHWKICGFIDEFNSKIIECGTSLEYCHHIASHHFQEVASSISTRKYLGYEPLEFMYDVQSFITPDGSSHSNNKGGRLSPDGRTWYSEGVPFCSVDKKGEWIPLVDYKYVYRKTKAGIDTTCR